MGTYVVYVDDPTNRARVHRKTCRHYMNRKAERLPDNRWHEGPFTKAGAFTFMHTLGKKDAKGAGCCNP